MATYYWVGGAGTWNATATTNWASSSGGAGGAGVPTSVDDVIFDAASNATAYTVTLGADAVCQDITVAGPLVGNVTFSLATTSRLNCFGNFTLPATGAVWTGTGAAAINFLATSTGKTITTNGVTLTVTAVVLNSATGAWTLGSALTTTSTFTLTSGSFDTSVSNYTLTCTSFTAQSAATINANASTIVCSLASATFAGGGLTYYNVSFTNTSTGTITTTGANTFNDLTVVTPVNIKTITFSANQTINGTLTLGATNSVITRVAAKSNITSTQRTLTCNAVATLADVDFADIQFAGACISGGALTGTRLGDCGGNDVATITFAAGVNKYYYSLAGGAWNGARWETSPSGTSPLLDNFPLAQDTIVIQDFGANASVSMSVAANYNYGAVDMSSRTLALTWGNGSASPVFHGDITLFSALTITGTSSFDFRGQGTQNITSASVSFTNQLAINNGVGSTRLVDNLTTTGSATLLTTGTLDLNNNAYTCTVFSSSNSNVRSIAFGTGQINVANNNTTVFNMSVATNFSYTGTPKINSTYAGAVGTRLVLFGTTNGTEANALDFYFTAGTDIVSYNNNTVFGTLDFTGFSGTSPAGAFSFIYRNLILSATMTVSASGTSAKFSATSGIQQITTAGKTLDFPLDFNGIGGTFAFQDALTQGSTRAFTVTNGTVQLKNGVTSTVGSFATSGTNQKFLQSTTPGSQATISQASGTVNVSYLSIQDINATGGAIWFAPIDQLNVDVSNNDGWDFFVQLGQYMYTRRKNKRLLIS